MKTTSRSRHSAFDIALGQRLRQLRIERGITQTVLADALGVTFQQIQKYEKGENAIASSRMGKLCKALEITPDQFYALNNVETRELAGLSNYAIRTAKKLDTLTPEQKRAITMLLTSFGVEIEE